jgi:putative methionine-R-sulfoxide reductase with GAF domain
LRQFSSQQAFNYYHVHIYLYDLEKEFLVLTGGTGEGGKIMLSQEHKIPSGKGLIGRASDSGNAVLISDTSKDENWLLTHFYRNEIRNCCSDHIW